MYNERTRKPDGAFCAMRSPRNRYDTSAHGTMDIPSLDLNGETMNRRRCDGSMRGEPSGSNCGGCTEGNCGGFGIKGNPLAMVYAPCQAWMGIYTPEIALARGTLFSELDLPFEPSGCKRGCM